ncbi:lamin tail domain-containing protein [Chloroflexi bacterium TSY]|nr:lamin tail domain-containing protein [Chloroflexi bacterium TSY]
MIALLFSGLFLELITERSPVGKASAMDFSTLTEPQKSSANNAPSEEIGNAQQASDQSILVNEIHYDPHVKTDAAEFIELFNRGPQPIDLSNWALDGAVEFLFPQGIILSPGSYLLIAQDPATMLRLWGVNTLGPYRGKLSTRGEEIIVRNLNAEPVDRVAYQLGFPWPTVGDPPGPSLQLINPTLENNLGGSWRSGPPTPGRANSTFVVNSPPLIHNVSHSPQQPTSQNVVQVTTLIADSDGIASVELSYQIVAPGDYIAIDDPRFATSWAHVPMAPDSNHATSGNNSNTGTLYRADLPASLHRHLVRYRIRATDLAGQSVAVPYADDPQPNFAYFVYDGVPPWRGATNPESDSARGHPITYNFPQLEPLPVYHLLSTHAHVRQALFTSGYKGSDYKWRGTLVYDGVVYDHIRYRARGGTWRYRLGKNMVKFDFNRGHYLQAYDNNGNPYSVKWDKLNFSSVIQHGERLHRGEQGLFESTGFRLFNLAGVEAPKTHFAHFRVIDDADEATKSQYKGDFWGLYLVVEQMDGRFLDEHDLPDGNLYKMEWGFGEKNNQGPNATPNSADLAAFINAYEDGQEEEWWRANFDLARYYSFRSILEAIHHYDVNNEKNYFYYLNPETNRWAILPWDLDQTWANNMFGSGTEPFKRHGVLRKSALKLEYLNRLRELRDLLFNTDQVSHLIEEYARVIDDPNIHPSFAAADRARWDYSKDMESKWTEPRKAGRGRFYKISPTGDFRGMIQVMLDWVRSRGEWIDYELLEEGFPDRGENRKIPRRTTVSYVGAPNFPADDLRFTTSPFNDPQGPETFAGMQWRVAELNYPGARTFHADQPYRYEIEASWESPLLTTFTASIRLPNGVCREGYTCRVRVRMMDRSGRWGHWSQPVEFVAGRPLVSLPSLVLTEIMYNPLNQGSIPGTKLEFIELKNNGNGVIDLTNIRFSDGIDYRFPLAGQVAPGEYIVVANDADRFAQRYGFSPFGEFRANLSNGGERIVLEDAFDRVIISLEYDDEGEWPEAADGNGYSLVLINPLSPSEAVNTSIENAKYLNADQWRSSISIHGSPGMADPLPVRVNEILVLSNGGNSEGFSGGVEIYNPTPFPADIGDWYLTDSLEQPRKFRIPRGTVIPPGGFITFEQREIAASQGGLPGLLLNPNGGGIYLVSAADGRITGYQHGFTFASPELGVSFGRYVNSMGQETFPPQSQVTFGQPNLTPKVGPIAITKLVYNPKQGDELIELTNLSSQSIPLYDPERPGNRWRIPEIFYQFPSGIELAPGQKLLIVPTEPSQVCVSAKLANLVPIQGTATFSNLPSIIGPYPLHLHDKSGLITLERPLQPLGDGTVPYAVVDMAEYRNQHPWPTSFDGVGCVIERKLPPAYGREPRHWMSSTEVQTASIGPRVAICSFEAYSEADETIEQMNVQWVTHLEEGVSGYHLWRGTNDDRSNAVRLTQDLITVQQAAVGNQSERPDQNGTENEQNERHKYRLTIPLPDAEQEIRNSFFWLQAIGTDGVESDVAFTSLRVKISTIYMPIMVLNSN